DDGRQVLVGGPGPEAGYDAVVLATGAWLGRLASRYGVRTAIQAGRGYSFSVPVKQMPAGPVYLPAARLACTPPPGRRLGSRPAGAGLDRGRVARIADGLPALLDGADPGARQDEWVGARPCTPDGLPVIGRTRSDRVFVAGGHGMWGVTLGPVTGRLLAGL